MTIVAVSDVHLGYTVKENGKMVDKCNKEEFNKFLDELSVRDDVNHLVICGDFLDMWRRDIAGVVIENTDILFKLQNLQPKIKIHYVAGNHDYHVKDLENFGYQFDFSVKLILPEDGINYRFEHGYDFDPHQNTIYFDALCHTTDEQGDIISEAWEILLQGQKWWDRVNAYISRSKGKAKGEMGRMLTAPKERLQDIIDDVEKKACASVEEGEILIFGHTHEPFINKKENVANTGSWEKESSPSNTYVEIDGGKIALKVFGGEEISGRLKC